MLNGGNFHIELWVECFGFKKYLIDYKISLFGKSILSDIPFDGRPEITAGAECILTIGFDHFLPMCSG